MNTDKNNFGSENNSEPQKNSGNKYVTRYRRTKNLSKKCAEISKQCDLDIVLVMFDRKNNRLREVYTSKNMTLDDLNGLIQDDEKSKTLRHQKEYVGPECGERKLPNGKENYSME